MRFYNRPSTKIAALYIFIGIVWILTSDSLLLLFFSERELEEISYIQTSKGIFYVVATGVLLYLLVSRYYRKLRDKVTQLRKLNENLILQKQQLEESNAELEQFAYVVSHDLQEPLRMVSSFLTRIETKYSDDLDERGKQYIQFAIEGALKMRSLILDLLDYSRVGKDKFHSEPVDMNLMVTDIRFLFRKTIKETHATLISSELPVIISDKAPVQLVMRNIIGNALKYHKPGEAPVVRISARRKNKFWEFCISDNGIGIDPIYHDRIFNIFQRLHNDRDYQGSGMGLAITKKVIENLGGQIWLQSTEGEGSSFYFSLPAEKEHL